MQFLAAIEYQKYIDNNTYDFITSETSFSSVTLEIPHQVEFISLTLSQIDTVTINANYTRRLNGLSY